MIPFYYYDQTKLEMVINYYIQCEIGKLINTKYLVHILEREFSLSSSASEFIYEVYWDKKFRCIGMLQLSKGYDDFSKYKYGNVFKSAVLVGASSFTIVHNHPSGLLIESEKDIITTQTLLKIGSILDIKLYEQVLVANNNYKIINVN